MGAARLPLLEGVDRILLFYEPLVLLILGSVFVLVNPPFHGMVMAILVIGGFTHIKNYISGRIIQLDKTISLGNRMKIENQKGIISKIGRLGLQLKAEKGTQFINYSKLMEDGFMLLSGEEIGGYYNLKITPKAINEKTNYTQQLLDFFATTPYLDWNFKPHLSVTDGETAAMNAKIMVREDSHLQDLVKVIEERGFVCKVK